MDGLTFSSQRISHAMRSALVHFLLDLNVGNQLLDGFDIHLIKMFGGSKAALAVGRLLGQNMTSKSPLHFYLPGPSLFEAFRRSSICLQFRHVLLPLL